MTYKTKEFYNKIYKNSTDFVFGNPEKELMRLLRRKEPKILKKALDVGCGDGRNAIFLAKRGYSVTCIDNSIEALKKIENRLKGTRIRRKLKLINRNLKQFYLEKEHYDLIMCIRTFHEIGKKTTLNIIRQMQHLTRPRGINYLAFFIHRKGTYMKKDCYYPDKTEILKEYSKWRIVLNENVLETHNHYLPESSTRKIKHTHYICHLIFKKPN